MKTEQSVMSNSIPWPTREGRFINIIKSSIKNEFKRDETALKRDETLIPWPTREGT